MQETKKAILKNLKDLNALIEKTIARIAVSPSEQVLDYTQQLTTLATVRSQFITQWQSLEDAGIKDDPTKAAA